MDAGYRHGYQLHRPLPLLPHACLDRLVDPGAALLITSLGNFTLAEAIGAFIISSLLITLCGISGWFDG
jgi:hypothetical protein